MLVQRVPVAREGVPFLGISALAAIVLALLQLQWWALAALALTTFILYFFRDPERIVPHEPGLIVSPADGKVIEVVKEDDPYFNQCGTIRVSVFMNVFDCHVNRSPVAGTVQDLRYFPGRFLAASKSRAMAENERAAVLLHDEAGRKFVVVQVAGLIARRILCFAQVGDALQRGERYGLIRFGSRLDIYLPNGCETKVIPGDRVVAGQSIIARFQVVQ